jgi:hypothetical protein
MNATTLITKAVGVAGTTVTSIAFVSLFMSMGANGATIAKAEAAYDAMPVLKAERIEVVGKALPAPYALNTLAAKKAVL